MKLADQILRDQMALDAALNDAEIAEMLEAYQYDEARILEGKALLNTLVLLNDLQDKEYGEQFDATDILNGTRQRAHDLYMKHLTLGRIAFEGKRGTAKRLQLNGPRQRGLSGWLTQAEVFYANLDGLETALAEYGVSSEELTQARELVASVGEALWKREQEQKEARESTRQRDAARKELKRWMRHFRQVARLALKDHAQKLESMGDGGEVIGGGGGDEPLGSA
ncbi:MAG: hypothetical protein RIG62_17665 [Cyclobacteriaceae bacterium]